MYDYLIVGCGLSGATCARLLAEKGNRVLIVEKRNHIGGNVFDEYDEAGILIHRYGPHIFHTRDKEVWDFLSQFTPWHPYQHRVLAYVRGKYVPLPINLDTINLLYGAKYDANNIDDFFQRVRQNDLEVKNARDVVIAKVGTDLYEMFFKGYTYKQWGLNPEELAPEVTARIPVRYNRDDRYFEDPYQGIPKLGYTVMVAKMIDHPKIHFLLNCDYKEIVDEIKYRAMINTGPIDYHFDYKFGPLPYRSLRFEYEFHATEYYQKAGTVNYPNDYDFTRMTEFKHFTGQIISGTTVVKEYPIPEGEPYYPIPRQSNRDLYKIYANEGEKANNLFFTGRLGLYKYANMDIVVKDAMELVAKLA